MLGILLNLILISFGSIALATSITFFLREKESGHIHIYTLLFGLAIFSICAGYSIMGFYPDISHAYIPRLFGLSGIDIFLVIELSFLLMELRIKQSFHAAVIGFFILYVIIDLVLFGSPTALNYVRYDFHTAYENVGGGKFLFHYFYITVIACTLLYFGIKWYKSKKKRRDKIFAIEVICANFVVIFATIPDVFHTVFSTKYPTFSYSISLTVVYFSWWFACRWHITFRPTVHNVSTQVFYSLDVPILIFDMDGSVSLQNPCAAKKFKIDEASHPKIRDLFAISDVENMLLLKKARDGKGEKTSITIKNSGESCILSTSIQKDTTGEPFCIIGAVFPLPVNKKELSDEDL